MMITDYTLILLKDCNIVADGDVEKEGRKKRNQAACSDCKK